MEAHEDKTGHHRAGKPGPEENPDRYPLVSHTEKGYTSVEDLEVFFDDFLHVRCPRARHECPYCERNYCHFDSLIVAVDGACPGNGTAAATTSGCGVYLSPTDVSLNESWRVTETPGYQHTNQRAELRAAIRGINIAMEYIRDGGQVTCDHPDPACRVKHLVIKSDSGYVVDGITKYVKKWESNGWRNAKGEPVKNRDLWETLGDWVDQVNDSDAVVSFWHVKRIDNQEADELANEAIYDHPGSNQKHKRYY